MIRLNRKAQHYLIVLCLILLIAFSLAHSKMKRLILQKRTTQDVILELGDKIRTQLKPHFSQHKLTYPPKNLTLLALKKEHRLELWTTDANKQRHHIRTYTIQKLSGKSGPKLREGDRQVPEGIYKLIGFNPNSAFHLSMKLNYPNTFDLAHAKAEGRTQPGSNIFIHGKAASIGCLAMGDQTIEELFVLAHDVGLDNISLIIAPHDPRITPLSNNKPKKTWVKALYQTLDDEFMQYQAQNTISSG